MHIVVSYGIYHLLGMILITSGSFLVLCIENVICASSVKCVHCTCRSVGAQHTGCSISYDTAAGRWLISAVSLPSHQSPAFHFISQLLDQIDTGLNVATVDIRLVSAQFPLHGVSSI